MKFKPGPAERFNKKWGFEDIKNWYMQNDVSYRRKFSKKKEKDNGNNDDR